MLQAGVQTKTFHADNLKSNAVVLRQPAKCLLWLYIEVVECIRDKQKYPCQSLSFQWMTKVFSLVHSQSRSSTTHWAHTGWIDVVSTQFKWNYVEPMWSRRWIDVCPVGGAMSIGKSFCFEVRSLCKCSYCVFLLECWEHLIPVVIISVVVIIPHCVALN